MKKTKIYIVQETHDEVDLTARGFISAQKAAACLVSNITGCDLVDDNGGELDLAAIRSWSGKKPIWAFDSGGHVLYKLYSVTVDFSE